jgi:hypothetical protein
VRVYDRSGSVLRTGPGEIRVKSVNGGYLFSTGSYPLSGHQKPALRCELLGGGIAVDRHSGCGCACEGRAFCAAVSMPCRARHT